MTRFDEDLKMAKRLSLVTDSGKSPFYTQSAGAYCVLANATEPARVLRSRQVVALNSNAHSESI